MAFVDILILPFPSLLVPFTAFSILQPQPTMQLELLHSKLAAFTKPTSGLTMLVFFRPVPYLFVATLQPL
jgi:hypothetical protein